MGDSNTALAQATFTILHQTETKNKCGIVFGKFSSQNVRKVGKKNYHFIINQITAIYNRVEIKINSTSKNQTNT